MGAPRPHSFFVCCDNSSVPGGIAPESLTFTPLDDMIFLKWEEPVEPNGLITQYEVSLCTCVCVFSGILITVRWCQRQVLKPFLARVFFSFCGE